MWEHVVGTRMWEHAVAVVRAYHLQYYVQKMSFDEQME